MRLIFAFSSHTGIGNQVYCPEITNKKPCAQHLAIIRIVSTPQELQFLIFSQKMTSMIAMAVLMCCVGKSVQQFTAYAATGMIDVYSPFTAVEPIFTSNVNRFGYQMDQSPLAINSQLDETYRLAALYWFLRRMYAPVGRVYGPPPPPIAPNRRELIYLMFPSTT